MISFFELSAVILGLIQGVLVLLNKQSNWIFYCLQMIALFVFSLLSRLYGDMVLSAFYFLVGAAAYMLWGKETVRNITICSWKTIALYSIATCGLSAICYYYLSQTNDVLPLLDSLTTTTSLLATILMVFRKLDCWVVWFLNDILYIAQYSLLPEQATWLLALYCVWSVMAGFSFIVWNKDLKRQKAAVKVIPQQKRPAGIR